MGPKGSSGQPLKWKYAEQCAAKIATGTTYAERATPEKMS